MPKKNKIEPLSSFERLLMWFSIRYAIGRTSIASQCLPYDLIEHYYPRISQEDRDALSKDIERELETLTTLYNAKESDLEVWRIFAHALGSKYHHNILATDGKNYLCFKFNNEFYPLQRYLEHPSIKCVIPNENIRSFA